MQLIAIWERGKTSTKAVLIHCTVSIVGHLEIPEVVSTEHPFAAPLLHAVHQLPAYKN